MLAAMRWLVARSTPSSSAHRSRVIERAFEIQEEGLAAPTWRDHSGARRGRCMGHATPPGGTSLRSHSGWCCAEVDRASLAAGPKTPSMRPAMRGAVWGSWWM